MMTFNQFADLQRRVLRSPRALRALRDDALTHDLRARL